MPKYYEFKVCGYYLYYTASCLIEAMHVHASDRKGCGGTASIRKGRFLLVKRWMTEVNGLGKRG